MKLTTESFERARAFMHRQARPLECATFARDFEAAPASAVVEALRAFRNDDGGFGHALEPDLRLPASSVLATTDALHVLQELDVPRTDPLVREAVDWLVAAFAPDIESWRSVPEQAMDYPHANHWTWALHGPGGSWPQGVLPRAEVLTHLYRGGVTGTLVRDQTDAFVAALEAAEPSIGADALSGCERFARTAEVPEGVREKVSQRVRTLGVAMVNRDPEAWSRYVPRPLKLAPSPSSLLADDLAADVERNLEYEIAHQEADGSWAPYWDWGGDFPDTWRVAKREWSGRLTLDALRSLRAFGRIEGL